MKFLSIEFAPLNIPMERRLQTLAACGWILTFVGLGFFAIGLFLYMLIYTTLYIPSHLIAIHFFPLLYVLWVWYDRETCNRGGRRIEWTRNWTWWKYFRDYFPIKLVKTVDLDPERNYLFCTYPHGILCAGAFGSFATDALNFSGLFPGVKPYVLTLESNFKLPVLRDLLLSLGFCSVSKESINYLLQKDKGGTALVIVVGGASESFYCRPGNYTIILRNRKGFVKLALQNGASLVPVFSFGETEIYDQVSTPQGSLLRRLQEFLKRVTGIAPIIFLGRGLLQYSFGVVPQRNPLTVLVGKPIDVEKVENPTQQQVDELHEKFTNSLIDLFEKHKDKYIDVPNAKLNIT